MTGDTELARTSAARAETLIAGAYEAVDIARAYGRIGDHESARRVFNTAVENGRAALDDPHWGYNMYVAIGEIDTAMTYLERMIEERFPQRKIGELISIPQHPIYDEIRTHPRFEELLEKARSPVP